MVLGSFPISRDGVLKSNTASSTGNLLCAFFCNTESDPDLKCLVLVIRLRCRPIPQAEESVSLELLQSSDDPTKQTASDSCSTWAAIKPLPPVEPSIADGASAQQTAIEGIEISSDSQIVSLWLISSIGLISLKGAERDRTRTRGALFPSASVGRQAGTPRECWCPLANCKVPKEGASEEEKYSRGRPKIDLKTGDFGIKFPKEILRFMTSFLVELEELECN